MTYLLRHGTRYDVTKMWLPVDGFGPTRYLVVSDPALAREVLTDDETDAQFSDVRHAVPFDNPFASADGDDTDWADQRAASVDAFTGASYRRAIAAAERQIATDVAALATDEPHDAGDLGWSLALRSVSAVLFGQAPPAAVERNLSRAVDHALHVTNLGLSSFLPVWTPWASLLGVWLQRDAITDWVADAVADAPPEALVWELADALDVDGDRLATVALFPLVAGFVSPEVMLSSTLELLGSHPREQATVERVARDLPSTPTNASLVGRRGAFRWPLLEALRLYPPTFFLTRRARRETTLGEYDVDAGELVWVDQWSIGRHPDHWSAPDAFRPGRWAEHAPTRDAFVPFGAGPRDCLGKNVALLQGELVLAALFREYDVTVDPAGLSPSTVDGGLSLSFDSPTVTLSR